jgi:hypothetical protein
VLFRSNTGLVLAIQRYRFFRWTALFIQIGNSNFPIILIFSDGDDIANPQIPTGFTTLTIHVHLTAIHRIGSQITGFKKRVKCVNFTLPQPCMSKIKKTNMVYD